MSEGMHSEMNYNVEQTEDVMEQGLDQNIHIPEDQIVVHGRMGPYLMGKSKWPQLMLPNEIIVQMRESESQDCITQSSQALGEQTEVVYD
jgi:hypothetical protein